MLGFIDLLIVDEAGQVSPDVAGAAFALAKKAVVVGDTLQISPVWSIPRPLDVGNLASHRIVSSEDTKALETFFRTGMTASGSETEPELSGTVMRIAQRATKYHKPELNERGMFLSEHRRCVDEIIEYCNHLAYQGKLRPMRGSISNHPLPHLGYCGIQGESQRRGGSRVNEIEARTIAHWIRQQRQLLEDHYGESLAKILGIVTPFRPQSTLIAAELWKRNITGVTVGTVHTFQGAERNIVIFSPVYGRSDGRSFFFDRTVNMLNVAVSRAKDSFLLFGDMGIFDHYSALPSGKLAKYLLSRSSNRISPG